MPLRLLLILMLLVQQFALPAMALLAPDAESAHCRSNSCCVVVESTTCCGKPVRTVECGKTGGECRCGVTDGDTEPVPATPRPQERDDLGSTFVLAANNSGVLTSPRPRLAQPVVRHAYRTHNETQALLCIWRT